MAEEEPREEIEDIANNEEPIKETVIETIIEEEEVKPTPKFKPKAKLRLNRRFDSQKNL